MHKNVTMSFLRIVLTIMLITVMSCKGNLSESESVNVEQDSNICTPVKVAVIQDTTGSIKWTGTPILQTDDLAPLIQLLYQCGGEIGFGLISENSNKGLIRFFINTPPVEPMEPSRKGNPYKVAQSFDIYKHEVDKFNSELASWRDDIEKRISMFIADVDMALKNNSEAKRSDVWQAIRRADLFLSESSNTWTEEPQKYALITTDGKDNVRKKKVVAMRSKGQILMVNSSGSTGDLDGLNPSRFESIASAVRFIIADVGGEK